MKKQLNPLEMAALEAWKEIKKGVEIRKTVKEIAETVEDFSDTPKKETFSLVSDKPINNFSCSIHSSIFFIIKLLNIF